MSKPILWLGPLEELDADFDPLLGRSASEPPVQRAAAPTPQFDPTRSVFDDPLDTPQPSVSENITLEPTLAVEPVAEPPATNLATATPDIEPVVTDAAPVETVKEPTTDFAHNNDPIPARLDTPEPIDAKLEAEVEAATAVPADARNAKKSFFGSLFSKRTIAPAAAIAGGASINDIWAKVEADQKAAETVQSDEIVDTDVPAEGIEQTNSDDIATATEPAPLERRNIWEDIDAQIDNQPEPSSQSDVEPSAQLQPDTATNTEHSVETIDVVDDIDAGHSLQQVEQEAHEQIAPTATEEPKPAEQNPEQNLTFEPQDEPQALAKEDVESTASETEPEITEMVSPADSPQSEIVSDIETIPTASSSADVEDMVSTQPEEPTDQSTPIEAVTETETLPDGAEEAPTITGQPKALQDAFNADKFWALPAGQQGVGEQAQSENEGTIQPEPINEASVEHDVTPEVETSKPQVDATLNAHEPSASQSQSQPELTSAAAAASQLKRRAAAANGKRRKKKAKKSYVGAFFGTFFFGVAAMMTVVSAAAPLGYPFDLMSSYRWYWVILAVVAAGIWGITRGWRMVAASFLVMALNLYITIPASGVAPSGGKTATAVVGWANVAGDEASLARIIKDADKRQASLLMLAEAPQGVFTPPAGWTLIEAPVANDPTAIAVLSKSSWRAVTVPGEPTMARPAAGDLTVIGVHPRDANKGRRKTPQRDALINRAGTRAGYQEGPTIVLGDFNAAPWDQGMKQFREFGNVTRVRCGGWAGTTYNQAFGLIGVAVDHAYVRNVNVTHCQLGATLPGGHHKPIWLYVAPKPPAPAPAPETQP